MNQEDLKNLIKRRHPEYEQYLPHWEFLASCYAGGRSWFGENIFKYIKEGETEFNDRLKRAYRFNHTREVVDLVSKYIFKAEIVRNQVDAPDSVRRFWKESTLGDLSISSYLRQIADKSSIYGRVWLVVDSNKSSASETVADDKEADARIYSYIVSPQNALDMSFDDNGDLNWILLHEQVRDDDDPFTSSGEMKSKFRLWTRESWHLFERKKEGRKVVVVMEEEGEHSLGVVPVFPVDHISVDESPYIAPSLIGDIAYLDRAVANYLSNLDAIIQDQTFSQLAMPAQGLMPGDDAYEKMLEMGTKRIFIYDGEGTARPEYISPDVKQAELIVTVIKQIINEIYHTVGMAGERTKQDNAVGIDNSSGVAKAYDFERVNALLTSKAGALLKAEQRMVELVAAWSGETVSEDIELIRYPDSFDVRGLSDEFDIATQLSLLDAPDTVRRKQMEQVVEKLFPDIADAVKKAMMDDIQNNWPVSTEFELPTPFRDESDDPRKGTDSDEKTAQDSGQQNQ